MLRDRFLSFSMVLVIGFLLLVSLVLSAVLAGVGKYLSGVAADVLGGAAGGELRHLLRRHHLPVRPHLQGAAGRDRALARRVGGRGGHGRCCSPWAVS